MALKSRLRWFCRSPVAIENRDNANYELAQRLAKNGKETLLGTVNKIISKRIKITSLRKNVSLCLGHAVLCAKHLLKNQPFAVLLPMFWCRIGLLRTRTIPVRHYLKVRMSQEWVS